MATDLSKTFSDPGDALTAYLGQMRRHQVMTADEERRKAQEIASLRGGYWKALLSHPPHVDAIATLLGRELDAKVGLLAHVDAARGTARALRDRATRKHATAFDAAIGSLSAQLAYSDPECRVADRVLADLEALAMGGGAHDLGVRRPPQGSGRFRKHLSRVRGAHAALRMARNQFVKANLRLVVKMALRYRSALMPMGDLVQEGNLGLMKAVDRFDVRKGFRFSTYASWWIRHAITRATINKARTVRVPAHLKTTYSKVTKSRRRLTAELGHQPTVEDLARDTGLSAERIRDAQTAMASRAVSLEQERSSGGDDHRTLRDLLPDPDGNTAPADLQSAAIHEYLEEAIEDLTPVELDIVRRRFGLDGGAEMTLAQVGERHCLSRERIRQLQNRALAKMRVRLQADGIGASR